MTEDDAVSYFVTGSQGEDHGFALQPWSKVRFENSGIIIDENGKLLINVHHSSMPYIPTH